ncbi:GrpB family protein [Myxosarcina sp. GI1]|uniref:GrpB family protein n=1 Tax=Myxosarcina sp. GI1 TaxID=1541065 RepID=UPI000561635E|nr:GrpB family protein [Myxosarcina sp. GI1]
MKVEVVPHNPQWKNAFKVESKQIAKAIGENIITIHHIGSTAISTIYAKPIIDFLVEVSDLALVDERNTEMEALGYEAMGEFGIKNRRYFRKHNLLGIRTHHVHIFEVNSPEVKRHLAFRDYLIAYPQVAWEYSALKRKLAQKYPEDIEGYMDGKDRFIKDIEKKAVKWYGDR